jgi:hypothetical protein
LLAAGGINKVRLKKGGILKVCRVTICTYGN